MHLQKQAAIDDYNRIKTKATNTFPFPLSIMEQKQPVEPSRSTKMETHQHVRNGFLTSFLCYLPHLAMGHRKDKCLQDYNKKMNC